jgi:hypothetical protein
LRRDLLFVLSPLKGSRFNRNSFPNRRFASSAPTEVRGLYLRGLISNFQTWMLITTGQKRPAPKSWSSFEYTEYGSREYSPRDPEGHVWHFGTYLPEM